MVQKHCGKVQHSKLQTQTELQGQEPNVT